MIYRVPQVSTFNSDLKIIREVFEKYKIGGKKVADLGSGVGKMLRFLEKNFGAKMIGYEIDVSNIIIAKFLNTIFSSNSKVIKGNYFKADLKQYDALYIYLFPCLMEKVEKKVFSDCKKGTLVFVNAFQFAKHKPIDIFYKNGKGKIFVYEV